MNTPMPLPKTPTKGKKPSEYRETVHSDVPRKIGNAGWPVPALSLFANISLEKVIQVIDADAWADCCRTKAI
jgi:hypothetical protein